jgi:hypothetical protein
MHFCLTGQYSPQALNSIMDNPTVSRYEAAKQSIEARWQTNLDVQHRCQWSWHIGDL